MDDPENTLTDDRRSSSRSEMDGTVRVRFTEQTVDGPGQNLSDEGVFFVADASLKVLVQIAGGKEWHAAEIVRIQSMGDSQLGMAVKFV